MATQYLISTGTCALSTTTKTCLELPTSSAAGITVVGLEFTFSVVTAASCIVEWGTFTTTGTGTPVTPSKWGIGQGAAAQTGTVKVNNSVAATGFAAAGLPSWEMPLPGMYSILYAQGREFFQPVSINRCLNLTMSIGTSNVQIDLYFEH